MTTLYLVSQGDYSDYSVLGIYSTPEKAEYAVRLYGDDSRIEQYELDGMPPHPPGELRWHVQIMANGDVVSAFQVAPENEYRPIVPLYQSLYGGQQKPNCIFQIWARDKNHAIKIATEKRREMLANGTWGGL